MRLVSLSAALMGLSVLAAAAPPLPPGTRIQAQLKTKLDSQHARVGDAVTAVATAAVKDHKTILLPKGAVLTGRITAVVAAESPKSPSHLSLLFEQAAPKQGAPLALRAVIAQIVPAGNPAMDMGVGDMMGMPPPQPVSNDGGDAAAARNHGDTLGDQSLPAIVTAGVPAGAGRGSNGRPIRIILPENPAAAMGSELATPQGDLQLNPGAHLVLLVLPQ